MSHAASMRKWCGAALSIAAALSAIGLGAATASAQGPTLELTDEATEEHCQFVMLQSPTDVEGGCLIHAVAEAAGVEIRKHVFGIESHITKCKAEFQGRINENGEGYLLEQLLTDSPFTPSCGRRPCSGEGGERVPWPAQAEEGMTGEAGNSEYLTIELCVEQILGGGDETCDLDLPFEKSPGAHQYELGHASEIPGDGTSGFRCELVSHWLTETGSTHDDQSEQEITVTHLP